MGSWPLCLWPSSWFRKNPILKVSWKLVLKWTRFVCGTLWLDAVCFLMQRWALCCWCSFYRWNSGGACLSLLCALYLLLTLKLGSEKKKKWGNKHQFIAVAFKPSSVSHEFISLTLSLGQEGLRNYYKHQPAGWMSYGFSSLHAVLLVFLFACGGQCTWVPLQVSVLQLGAIPQFVCVVIYPNSLCLDWCKRICCYLRFYSLLSTEKGLLKKIYELSVSVLC